mgnify:CR=1 FL=1
MDLIIFERKAFEEFATKIEQFILRVSNSPVVKNGKKKTNNWLDHQDVCQRLKISKRTLQTLRDNGNLPIPKLAIVHIIYPKMWIASSLRWRTDEKKPNGKGEKSNQCITLKTFELCIKKCELKTMRGCSPFTRVSTNYRRLLIVCPKTEQPYKTMMSIYATRKWRICLKSAEGH